MQKLKHAASGATKGFLGLGAENVTSPDAAFAADLKTVEAATSLVDVSAATSISESNC